MAKEIKYGVEARSKAVNALEEIASIVGSTLGPGGKTVLLSRRNSADEISVSHTKDGFNVLNGLRYTDPVFDAVHKLCLQASANSVVSAGDGPQPLYSKVLTPKGWIEMGDVRQGMEICGTNGTLQTVLGVFPKGEKEIYKIEFSNGRTVECCADHLWTVTNVGTSDMRQETKTTAELAKDYLMHKSCGQIQKRYYTPQTAVEFYDNPAEMPLDPYLVGVLLGDGGLSGTGSVEISLGSKKEHIINKLVLPEGIYAYVTYVDNRNAFRIKLQGKDKNGKTMKDYLESIGLFGTKSGNKFIPKSYLYTSIANREKLLQGLLDTDGFISDRGLFQLSTISEELANDYMELARSLGRTVTVEKRERKENMSYSMTPIYRITELKGFKYGNRIDSITPTGIKTQMQCIKVSNPDHLYVTDGYIFTHNTTSTIVMAAAFANALVNSGNNPQAAARKFRKEIQKAVELIGQEAVVGEDAIYKVALTSSNGDEELTSYVMQAIAASSAYGTVIVEKNPMSREPYKIDKEYGYQAGTGYSYYLPFAQSIRPNLANNSEFTIKQCFVMPYNGDLMMMSQVKPMLETLARNHQQWNLVIICHQIAEDLAANLAYFNRQNPQAKVFVVRTTPSAELNGQVQQLNDIAAYTGAKVMDGGSLAHIAVEDFGDCKSIRIGPHKTFLLGRSDRNWIIERAEQNEESAKLAPSQMDRDIINSRNASLTGGCVKLIIGGTLFSDLQERADRADDAIKASQACGRSGALPGCGASYMRSGQLAGVSPEVLKALSSIHSVIMENFGEVPASSFEKSQTFYITENNIEKVNNFIEYGVADSFETIKSVITNAFELGLLVTNLGGYSLEADLDQMEQAARAKEILRGV